jgi:hypothetical protein
MLNMSCWVVPSLAAELWRMPLEQVMRLISQGAVPTKQEEGFTFIDVAPDSPKITSPMLKAEHRPATFIPAAHDDDIDMLIDEEVAITEEENTFGDWRAARARISLTRIGPPRKRLSA